eukprot:10473049-Alexandrium_andersonii.AAC.1
MDATHVGWTLGPYARLARGVRTGAKQEQGEAGARHRSSEWCAQGWRRGTLTFWRGQLQQALQRRPRTRGRAMGTQSPT